MPHDSIPYSDPDLDFADPDRRAAGFDGHEFHHSPFLASCVDAEAAATPETVRGFRSAAASCSVAEADGLPGLSVFDMSGLTLVDDPLPVTLGHVSSRVIGHATRVAIVPEGVLVEGVIWLQTVHARAVLARDPCEAPWQSSIVIECMQIENVPFGQAASVNGGTVEGPVAIVRRGRVVELGFTDSPADASTIVLLEKEKPGAVDEIREKLRARDALERVRLLEAWDLARPETRTRLADLVLADPSARQATAANGAPAPAPAPFGWPIDVLKAAGELERALLFRCWNLLCADTQQEAVRLIRDDLTPVSDAHLLREEEG